MSVLADLKTLYHLVLQPVRGGTHAERLNSFYESQAGQYDRFREKLLHGRETLMENLPMPDGGTWLDMGGGTGANLDRVGEKVRRLGRVAIIDLCRPLLQVARRRINDRGWTNAEVVEADAATVHLDGAMADVITFSYSLTMMPNWFAAVENACRLLRPGGLLGVVDFYVSSRHPPVGQTRHSWLTRTLWPAWFAADGVHLGPDRLAYLQWRFDTLLLLERRGSVPYLPGLRVPYFVFVGQRRAAQNLPA
ncbi:MAG: class I SAM-dependent methyltransferase [Opitutales bacterium]